MTPSAAPADVALVPKREPAMTGTLRYALSLENELRLMGLAVARGETHGPRLPRSLAAAVPSLAERVRLFFDSFPTSLTSPPARVLHLTMESLASALLTTRWPGPVVVTVHDVISYMTRHDPALWAYAHPLHALFDLLSLRGLRRADVLIADSEWTARMLAEHVRPGRPIRVVPLGVDLERFSPAGPPSPVLDGVLSAHPAARVIGFVGALVPRKNVTALVRALPEIRAAVPTARLIVIGRGTSAARARLEALVGTLGLGDAVDLLGEAPADAVPALYRRSDVVAVPSLYEGFGLPALEAMASGAAVVASRRSSLPEVVGDAGVLCDPRPQEIARAVIELLTDDSARLALGAAGEARARQFTWARTAALTRDVYAEAEAAPRLT